MKTQNGNPGAERPPASMQPTHLALLRVSMHALVQPLTLASVALLLLNDHILKWLIPSWLTGKLSDFAGLFFFPYLVLAFASLPGLALARLRRPTKDPDPKNLRLLHLSPSVAFVGCAIAL